MVKFRYGGSIVVLDQGVWSSKDRAAADRAEALYQKWQGHVCPRPEDGHGGAQIVRQLAELSGEDLEVLEVTHPVPGPGVLY